MSAARDLLAGELLAGGEGARIAVEALAVLAGLKPLARFTAGGDSAARLCALLDACGLRHGQYVPPPDDWGYRHATAAERAAFSRSDARVYYARDAEALEQGLDAQRRQDNVALGRALGYPACCIAANEYFGAAPMTDLLRVARTPGGRDWRLNVFLTEMEVGRGSPYYLISHFPCHLGCRASIDYAAALLDALRDAVPAFAAQLERLLPLPLLLRDEEEPPEARRYGNFGAQLYGGGVGDAVFYQGWRPLRASDRLPEARLDQGDCIAWQQEDLCVLSARDGREVARLPTERWHLVAFQ
ncbi:hypothetical protein JW897_06960 [Chromobacterium alkanivorans]|uniref:hypothetical protein n=1 Tax=Chromobacterium alkanivorans TaxID=1071719 RepID=UPI001966E6A2|nr:hypothetical protein [Chromobacterium alkanivorans]MBN3003474.1 hypothetical protein [Chromobacterium alkanivorans]